MRKVSSTERRWSLDRRWLSCFKFSIVCMLLTHVVYLMSKTETSCENGIIYNSTCYKIHREDVNWFTAVNRCLSNNGSLAVFNDNITKYFATTLLYEHLWIGLIKSWWTWPDAGLYSWHWHQQLRVVLMWLITTIIDLAVVKNNNFCQFLSTQRSRLTAPAPLRFYRGPCQASFLLLVSTCEWNSLPNDLHHSTSSMWFWEGRCVTL